VVGFPKLWWRLIRDADRFAADARAAQGTRTVS
jgi:hypothetical protein